MAETVTTPTETPGAAAGTGATTLTADIGGTAGNAAAPGTAAEKPTPATTDVKADAKSEGTTPEAQAPGEKAPQEKAAADAKPAEGAPLELKLPDGIEAGPALDNFKTLAKEQGFKPEQAQKLVDFWAGLEQQKAQAHEQERASWVSSLKADKEIGGQKFDSAILTARKAVAAFAPELRTVLEDPRYHLGDRPELVRAFYRIGKAMAEDSVAGATGGPLAPAPDPDAHLKKMYPTMFKES